MAATSAAPDPLAPPLRYGGRRAEAEALARVMRQPKVTHDTLQRLMGCPPPVWMNTPKDKHRDGICVIMEWSSRCQVRATHRVWVGCTAGEHLDYSDTCGTHAVHLREWKAVFHCQRCWDAIGIISDARVIRIEPIDSPEA